MELVLLAQAIDLFCCILWHGSALLLLGLPSAVFAILNRTRTAQGNNAAPEDAGKASLDTDKAGHERRRPQCCFYEGVVFHARMAPVKNSFR